MVKKIAIVSLSSGILGEEFAKTDLEIGLKRLEEYGLEVKLMPHALCGIEYTKNHPKERADDLLTAFADDSIDMILTAIGGDDTYRLLPFLFENGELKKLINDKIFLGFSDTTINHLMLHKAGLNTFYGQAFFTDLCQTPELLPYSAGYFEELIHTGRISEIRPSDVWYEGRKEWPPTAETTHEAVHKNQGFQLLQGKSVFAGKILGGCLETIYDIFDNTRYSDSVSLCKKYGLFPDLEDWKGKILLLETCEEKPSPEHYREMLITLKKTGIFDVVSGVVCGKPMDEVYFEEYKKIITEVISDPSLPIAANINIGHAAPRCIIPFGVNAVVDTDKQLIRFFYEDEIHKE